jgi:hypothetical protein
MLCDPVEYNGMQPKLFSTLLSSGETFCIQHFSVDCDLEELYRQFFLQSTEHWDLCGFLEKFKESFQYMAGSHTSQAFIVSIDGDHLFEIEIHEATAHQPQFGGYRPKQGDFISQISAGRWIKFGHAVYAECLEQSARYFLQFPEVRRLVVDGNRLSLSVVHQVLLAAGFQSCPGNSTLYVCQRN